jgi:hypothetical protein
MRVLYRISPGATLTPLFLKVSGEGMNEETAIKEAGNCSVCIK